ncbi:hypothetical protein V6L77_13660 [Pannonibacter sp. Pt2-lr]
MAPLLDRFDKTSLQLDAMLVPAPLRIETGIERLTGDVLRVEVRTELANCNGKMLDWWFKEFDTTQHLLLWHPTDHVEHGGWNSQWQKAKNYVGATIRAVESLGIFLPSRRLFASMTQWKLSRPMLMLLHSSQATYRLQLPQGSGLAMMLCLILTVIRSKA